MLCGIRLDRKFVGELLLELMLYTWSQIARTHTKRHTCYSHKHGRTVHFWNMLLFLVWHLNPIAHVSNIVDVNKRRRKHSTFFVNVGRQPTLRFKLHANEFQIDQKSFSKIKPSPPKPEITTKKCAHMGKPKQCCPKKAFKHKIHKLVLICMHMCWRLTCTVHSKHTQ